MASHAQREPDPLIGRDGVASSDLHPSGRATIDGEERDVLSESGYIDRGRVAEMEITFAMDPDREWHPSPALPDKPTSLQM